MDGLSLTGDLTCMAKRTLVLLVIDCDSASARGYRKKST